MLQFGQVALRKQSNILQLEKREKQLQKFGGSSDFIIQPHHPKSHEKGHILHGPFCLLEEKGNESTRKMYNTFSSSKKIG